MGDFIDDVSASFVALCNFKDGNIVQAMAQAQANSVDAWSYYQAKSTKEHMAEGMVDQVTIQRDTMPGLSAEARALLDRKIAELSLIHISEPTRLLSISYAV